MKSKCNDSSSNEWKKERIITFMIIFFPLIIILTYYANINVAQHEV